MAYKWISNALLTLPLNISPTYTEETLSTSISCFIIETIQKVVNLAITAYHTQNLLSTSVASTDLNDTPKLQPRDIVALLISHYISLKKTNTYIVINFNLPIGHLENSSQNKLKQMDTRQTFILNNLPSQAHRKLYSVIDDNNTLSNKTKEICTPAIIDDLEMW